MDNVYVLLEKYKGRNFCVTASTDAGLILRKAKELTKKAEAQGKLAPLLSPWAEGDLSEAERQNRDFEYSIKVFENEQGRPLIEFCEPQALTLRKMLSIL